MTSPREPKKAASSRPVPQLPEAKQRQQTVAEARSEMQANAAATATQRRAELAAHFDGEVPGRRIIYFSLVVTVIFVLATVAALLFRGDDTKLGQGDLRGADLIVAIVDLVIFGLGCGLFLVALWGGAQRSREVEMNMPGWWILLNSAPTSVQNALRAALGVQIIVGLFGAAARPSTALAFGVLVPIFGCAMLGLWGARYGYFPTLRIGSDTQSNRQDQR